VEPHEAAWKHHNGVVAGEMALIFSARLRSSALTIRQATSLLRPATTPVT
jgi:hypothetical protein